MKFIFSLFALCLIIVSVWFYRGNILGGGDEGLQFYKPSISFNNSKTAWVEYGTGMGTITWLPRANLLYFYSIPEKLGIATFMLQASLIFIIMFVAAISIYKLCLIVLGDIKESKLISAVTAVFYLLNPYAVSQVWARGQSAQYLAFGLLPLSVLLFLLGVKKKNFLYAILTVFVSFIFAAAYSFFSFIIVYWLILGFVLLFNFLTTGSKLKEALFSIFFFLIAFLLWIFIHSWWLVPLLLSSGSIYSAGISGANENLGTLMGVSKNFPPDILIRLLQRTYFFDPSAFSPVYSLFIFQLISWIPVLFLLIGLYKTIKNKLPGFKFFIIVFTLGLIVSLGANPPFGWLFVEVFRRVTILQAFRNPFEKFGLVFILGYSPLFAYGLVSLFNNIKYRSFTIFLILILTCGVFAWPIWTGRAVAGPDKKVGLSVPPYYKDLQTWAGENNEDYRLFMTPIWKGDGASYLWGDAGRFQGTDPMIYLLDQPTISNSFYAPISYEFIPNIRKYIGRVNIAPALTLLRAKYLVDRQDAIFTTKLEKDHKRYLTEAVYIPQKEAVNITKLCKNLSSVANEINPAWIACPVADTESNWDKIRYLHVKIRTDVASLLDITIMDKNGIRVRWDGRFDSEYSTEGSFTTVTIPLGNPTEYNAAIDYSKVMMLEIQARPKDRPEFSVNEINLEEISLDPGKEEKVDNFRLIKTFGNLEVYEPISFKSPPQFGSLAKISFVPNFIELFEQVNRQKDLVKDLGFLVTAQNQGKDLRQLETDGMLQVVDKEEISGTRFWLMTNGSQGFILLSKTFDPQWILIPRISRDKLSGNLFEDLDLLSQATVGEENHFAINGYANLWKVDGQDQEYVIIYKPQIIADIGAEISRYSLFVLSAIMIFWWLKKRYVGSIKNAKKDN
ncbi:hypothetical protein HYU45_02650 [Candidatus Daviesbacteria bacterium]|nr:hypothetical protein [Candidatus Daviesbacteria bacterium]